MADNVRYILPPDSRNNISGLQVTQPYSRNKLSPNLQQLGLPRLQRSQSKHKQSPQKLAASVHYSPSSPTFLTPNNSPGGSGGCSCSKGRAGGGGTSTKRVTKKKTTTNNKTKKTKK